MGNYEGYAYASEDLGVVWMQTQPGQQVDPPSFLRTKLKLYELHESLVMREIDHHL